MKSSCRHIAVLDYAPRRGRLKRRPAARAMIFFGPTLARAVGGRASVGALSLCVAHYSSGGLGGEAPRCEGEPRSVLRFGLIADVQYCDIDDGMNFGGTEFRYYRGSLGGAARAAAAFAAARGERGSLRFVAQLGDIIDGQNGGTYGAGLAWRGAPRSDEALARVLDALDGCDVETYHCVGNHELYNFDSAALSAGPLNDGRHTIAVDGRHYFSFRETGWTFVVLNPYEVSSMRPKHTEGYAAAAALLEAHNPNDVLGDAPCDFFAGLEGENMRFVPFNGGCGGPQRAWLRTALAAARARGDAVAVFSHLPLFHEAASWRNVAFDAPEVLAELRASGNVAAVFAGHSHRGGFALDDAGIAHCTVEATLTHATAFAIADCRADGSIALAGYGDVPSRDIAPPRRARL